MHYKVLETIDYKTLQHWLNEQAAEGYTLHSWKVVMDQTRVGTLRDETVIIAIVSNPDVSSYAKED